MLASSQIGRINSFLDVSRSRINDDWYFDGLPEIEGSRWATVRSHLRWQLQRRC
jgi:hypothetical protein